MASSGSIAPRYALALADLATEAGLLEEVAADLVRVEALFCGEGGHLLAILSNPGFTMVERRALLEGAINDLSLSTLVANTLRILLDRHRLTHLPAILLAWREILDIRAGRMRASVTSATPLEPATEAAISQALGDVTGLPVTLQTRVDSDLIAGLVVQIKDTVYDASLKTRLVAMRALLLQPIAESQG